MVAAAARRVNPGRRAVVKCPGFVAGGEVHEPAGGRLPAIFQAATTQRTTIAWNCAALNGLLR